MSFIARAKSLFRALGVAGPAPPPGIHSRCSTVGGRRQVRNVSHTSHRKGRIALIFGGGLTVTAYFAVSEIVPYSGRRHVALPSLWPILYGWCGMEGDPDEIFLSRMRILPADDARSIRVRRICNEITHALERSILREEELHSHDGWILSWISKQWRPSTEHLEGRKWEVLVAYGATNATCLPSGKIIIIFNGSLENFETDAEIATILCHEVAHAVARHSDETATKLLFVLPLMNILIRLLDVIHDVAQRRWFLLPLMKIMLFSILTMEKFFIQPSVRRNELEADYIGLMLLATAGYDPHVALMVLEKMGQMSVESEQDIYGSTHPSDDERVRKLAQPKVIEEALSIYRQAIALREVDLDASELARQDIDANVSFPSPS